MQVKPLNGVRPTNPHPNVAPDPNPYWSRGVR
jgi:hypothetical protein